ncbi:hybrid sensor histidine kinase/response regulator [Rhodoferax antarcticus]|uniref:hybrid sensor histidine kinase/response regulator n=1 Tax=Rhodoferax antarcticus TaxID=81479 RepID=UPI0009F93C14|nr:sensor histidine kinase [Rhodoferax antarcticus]MCW2312769.1 signal transduction histidine kinase [Rhodoferax antarcticus]
MLDEDQQQHPTLRVLHLEDSPQDHLLVKREFQKSGEPLEILCVENLPAFEQALTATRFDVVLADYRLPGFTALDAWQVMQRLSIRLPFVLLSGAIGETAAVQAIQAGMSDYLPKEDLAKLRHVTQRAIETHRIVLAREHADAELLQSQRQLASFAEQLQLTIEQERAAIAREIHDDIGGSLAAIRFDLAWISRHTLDTTMLTHVDAATEMLQHAVQASQRIMMSLRPAILDQGLAAAMQWLGDSFSRRTGIATQIKAQLQTEQLPKAIQLAAYRTAQEALTNASKHAQCTQVKIDLVGDEHFLTLEIADNGQGMTETTAPQGSGFGLNGLKERAKTVGGWLDVSSHKGKGTSITLSIPLNGQVSQPPDDTRTVAP